MTEEPKYLRKGCSVAAVTRLAQNEVNAPLIETREQARSTHLSTPSTLLNRCQCWRYHDTVDACFML